MTSSTGQGLLDANVLILRRRIAPDALPAEMAISAVPLAELSAGPHEVRSAMNKISTTSTPSGVAAGRKPGCRIAGLMIAATAIAEELPLYTTSPDDFTGLDHLLTVVPVSRPEVPPDPR